MTAVFADWGTTNLRAWFVDDEGGVLGRHSSGAGLKLARSEGFGVVLDRVIDELGARAAAIVLLSGMVGSRRGWQEVPYVNIPAGPRAIAEGSARIVDRERTWILPGVALNGSSPEVIRGEEVQVLGTLEIQPDVRRICLPGTHSKWITVDDGNITRIATHMTGELFEVLSRHTILAEQMVASGPNDAGFERGLELSRTERGFENALFQVRTRHLFGSLSAEDSSAFLSGFLIGYELRHELAETDGEPEVALCGSEVLNRLYALALSHFGVRARVVDGERATLAGFSKLRGRMEHV